MRKLFITIICLSSLVIGSIVFAGEGDLRMGITRQTGGHSDSDRRCIDDGWGAEVGYDYTLYHNDFQQKDFSFDLDVGPEFMVTRYQTAKRKCVECPRYDKRTDTSVNLSVIIKPTLNIQDEFFIYGIGGVGSDYMDQDGLDGSYTYGCGIDYQFSHNMGVGVSYKTIKQGYVWNDRSDTGWYRYITAMVIMSF